MKITLSWTPLGAAVGAVPTSFVIVDSPANIPYENFRINGTRQVQEDKIVRALTQLAVDRGNRKTSISFTTTRGFASIDLAEAFNLNHEPTFPTLVPMLMIIVTGQGTSGSVTRYMANTVLVSVDSRIKAGATTEHSYQFIGPAVSLKATG